MVLLAGGCIPGPALSVDAYRRHAEQSATALLSAVRTALLAARLDADERALSTTVDVTVSEAEDDALSAAEDFATRQPPTPATDPLRRRLTELADEAGDGLAGLRIALRRSDEVQAANAERRLMATARGLEEVRMAQ